MLVAIEPTWTGTIHAPGNSALLDIAILAFPDQRMSIHAEAGHVRGVQSLLKAASPDMRFHPIVLSSAFRQKPHIVSLKTIREGRAARAPEALAPRCRDVIRHGFESRDCQRQ
jgi:hypothetical protein